LKTKVEAWISRYIELYYITTYPSHSIVNAIGGKHSRALRRPNEGRKYNSNTLKNRNNRTKRLALLGRCPSR
jgi:hypothetical protein